MSKSPATTWKVLPLCTQCAAVSTQSRATSVPPQKWNPLLERRLTCHFHSHSVAGWPFTMSAPISSLRLSTQGVSSGPLAPHSSGSGVVVDGGGVGSGVDVVTDVVGEGDGAGVGCGVGVGVGEGVGVGSAVVVVTDVVVAVVGAGVVVGEVVGDPGHSLQPAFATEKSEDQEIVPNGVTPSGPEVPWYLNNTNNQQPNHNNKHKHKHKHNGNNHNTNCSK